MRGLYSSKTEIRHMIFKEVARFAYENRSKEDFERIPYELLPGEQSKYRSNIFPERAIVGERLRTAMGMPYRSASSGGPITEGLDDADTEGRYYTPPQRGVQRPTGPKGRLLGRSRWCRR